MNSSAAARPSTTLRRTLSLPLITLYGLGVTIGAGIYVLVGETVLMAGTFAPISFLLAALVVGFTAFSYAEFATRMPVSAGAAAYVSAGLRSKHLSLFVGLAVALSGIISAAAVSIGAAGYLAELVGGNPEFLTLCIVLSMGLLAWWGISQSVTAAATITVLEIGGLVLVIFWAFFMAEPLGVFDPTELPEIGTAEWRGIWAAAFLAFFAFVGFEDIVNIAEEAKDPVRLLPRAIILTLLITTLLYVAVVSAVLYVVPLDILATSDAPLSHVFDRTVPGVQFTFSWLAVIATINGVLIQIIMASRVLYGMANREQLPSFLSQVSPRTRTPGPATCLVVLAIATLSLSASIENLASYTAQVVLVVFIFVNLSLVSLKTRSDEQSDIYEVSGIVPVLGVLTSAVLLSLSFQGWLGG